MDIHRKMLKQVTETPPQMPLCHLSVVAAKLAQRAPLRLYLEEESRGNTQMYLLKAEETRMVPRMCPRLHCQPSELGPASARSQHLDGRSAQGWVRVPRR